MFTWAISLLTVAIVVAAIGFAWFAASPADIAWVFVVGGLIVLLALAASDRRGLLSKGPSDAHPER